MVRTNGVNDRGNNEQVLGNCRIAINAFGTDYEKSMLIAGTNAMNAMSMEIGIVRTSQLCSYFCTGRRRKRKPALLVSESAGQ